MIAGWRPDGADRAQVDVAARAWKEVPAQLGAHPLDSVGGPKTVNTDRKVPRLAVEAEGCRPIGNKVGVGGRRVCVRYAPSTGKRHAGCTSGGGASQLEQVTPAAAGARRLSESWLPCVRSFRSHPLNQAGQTRYFRLEPRDAIR